MSRTLKLSLGALTLAVAATSVLFAQVGVTLQLRNGESFNATLIDLGAAGFEVSVNGSTRRIPKDQVAMIDFGPSVKVTASAFQGMTALDHLVVLRNGDTFLADFDDVGGTSPLRLSFKTARGDRELTSNDVARIYLARPSTVKATPDLGDDPGGGGGMQADGSIAVPANQPWTDTTMQVRVGEYLRFDVSRTIRFGSGDGDTATADGNAEGRARAVLRSVPVRILPVGGLIGRVGSGQPFAIGTAPEPIRMPATGRLWLGINDLSFEDNSGWFRVVINRGR